MPPCSEAGVIGALTGVVGALQALEVIKEITGAGQSLAGKLLLYDALETSFRTIRLRKDPSAPAAATEELAMRRGLFSSGCPVQERLHSRGRWRGSGVANIAHMHDIKAQQFTM